MGKKTSAPDTTEVATRPARSPVYAMADRYEIEPEKLVSVLRKTVLKPDRSGNVPSNEEIAAFVIVANQYGLNPFTREIHGFSSKDKGVVPIVGVDGWARLVNRDDRFNGCEFEEEEGDDGKPFSMTCIMHVKGRDHAIKVTEWYKECYRPTGPWNQMPRRMLRHKCFMQAGRLAFGLHGLYDEDEARDIIKAADGTEVLVGPVRTAKDMERDLLAEEAAESSSGQQQPVDESTEKDKPDPTAPSDEPTAKEKKVIALADAMVENNNCSPEDAQASIKAWCAKMYQGIMPTDMNDSQIADVERRIETGDLVPKKR